MEGKIKKNTAGIVRNMKTDLLSFTIKTYDVNPPNSLVKLVLVYKIIDLFWEM